MMAHTMRAVLLASAAAATFVVRRANNQPWPASAMPFGVSDHGHGADEQQLTEIAISLLGDATEPLFATARVLSRNKTDPRGKAPT